MTADSSDTFTSSTPASSRAMVVVSRDEMNLAEFPLAVLSTRSDPRIKTLEFEDSIKGKNGEIIRRSWIITGADKFGLPTASDDEVLLGLMKLTVDSGFQAKKVFFTRYELLKILNWTTEGRSYLRLQNAFDRLSGVRIKATNAFYDNETKSHSTKNFGIINAYEINDGRDTATKPSFFI
jgi:plasmid replication initiation protein